MLVVGAGPAGSAAAAWTSRFGMDTVLADAATFPRDKTCGDGLTPRAIAELERLGLGDWVRSHGTNRGLRAAGFGQGCCSRGRVDRCPTTAQLSPAPSSTTSFSGWPSTPGQSRSKAPARSTRSAMPRARSRESPSSLARRALPTPCTAIV
ncbi:NAD(P)/FAD-dependent oxidoreductase [Aeromicrobium sp. UC242_57]|uniref:NAD(P)/FAD-dependent oxidoreductase n=1 Tax=Aeromicrobium sp. UC242_57 TaxID=3374624 RepID=UPI00379179D2